MAFLSTPTWDPQMAAGLPRLQRPPKEPDVRFSLIRLSHTPSPGGMRGAVPDASHQADEPQILMVDHDP